MSRRLSEIDKLIIQDHFYLEKDDKCYFLGEYTPRQGYAYSDTNQLISNLKKSPLRKGKPEWKYKVQAITSVAGYFVETIRPDWLENSTLVPMPPSKHKNHAEYDDRILQILMKMKEHCGGKLDVRELLIQTETMPAAHEQEDGQRPKPEDLIKVLKVNEDLRNPEPSCIGIFDDMITAGSHFKAAQHVLRESFPKTHIVGIFVSRRVNADGLDEFMDDAETDQILNKLKGMLK